MRFGKLYIKIFLSFVFVMIVTESLIYLLFTHSERVLIGYRMEKNTVVKVGLLKDLIDEKAKWVREISPLDDEEIRMLMTRMGRIYNAEIWISHAGGKPLMKSFSGELPGEFSLLNSEKASVFGEIRIYYNISKNHRVYASAPLKADTLSGMNLNIIFNEAFEPQQKYSFALGLIIIGAVVALLVIPVSRIITERIKAVRESALRFADGDLSRRVKVKTGDEIGELGLAFNQMAERLERMILGGRELTANVSHELRTPLTRIRIAEELLREELDKEDFRGFRRHLDSIREDIEELDALIGRILELSKLDIHETAFKYEKLDISDLLNEMLERIESIKIRKKLLVDVKMPPGIIISGDRESLSTAFSNIFDNAAKFSPEKGEISITFNGDRDAIRISITNTFEEMPEEDLARIFEPFYRSNTSNAAGSGLGLSIAAKIIRKHGGNISAANSNNGLEINVSLPLEKAQMQAAA